jgi:hypothetical protein
VLDEHRRDRVSGPSAAPTARSASPTSPPSARSVARFRSCASSRKPTSGETRLPAPRLRRSNGGRLAGLAIAGEKHRLEDPRRAAGLRPLECVQQQPSKRACASNPSSSS